MSENYLTIQSSRLYIWFQLVGWSCYAGILIVALYLQHTINQERITMIVLSAITGLIITHLTRYLYFRLHIFEKKIAQLIPQVLLLVLLSAMAFEFLYAASIIGLRLSKETFNFLNILGDVISLFFVLLIWSIIYFANHFIRKSRIEEIKNLQLTSANNEIELNHLRTQLNPHFLFNALNSIRALIHIDPELAKESITKLSGILRNSLLFDKNKFINIEEECYFVSEYLALEKIRFEERLNVYWSIDEKAKSCSIPPLIIQTQVENAIKYGISDRIQGGEIKIIIQLVNAVLDIRVINTGSLNYSKKGTGVGQNNSLRRLQLLYGKNAEFNIFESNKEVCAQIKIKQT